MKYKKETPRITVKIIDDSTEEVILEYKDRTWMNVGELFQSGVLNRIIENDLPDGITPPKKLMVIAVSEYSAE